MAIVKVWNDNIHPYKEKYQDREIVIPSKGFIKMDLDEANGLISTMHGILLDADGQPDPRGFKMLRVDMNGASETVAQKYISNIDGKEFASQSELDEHLKQFKEKTVTDEKAEASIKRSELDKARRVGVA